MCYATGAFAMNASKNALHGNQGPNSERVRPTEKLTRNPSKMTSNPFRQRSNVVLGDSGLSI